MTIPFKQSPNYHPNRFGKVTHLVIHAMAGFYPYTTQTLFMNPASKVSAHYCISAAGEILQMVQEKDTAFHACRANPFTIGIEHEDKNECLKNGAWMTPEMFEASTSLAAEICKRNKIPVQNIIGHCDPLLRRYGNIHACPGPYFDFEKYRAAVTAKIAQLP